MKPYSNGTTPAVRKGGSAKKKKAAAATAGSKVQKTIAKASVNDLSFLTDSRVNIITSKDYF